jgi:hypothetical protein
VAYVSMARGRQPRRGHSDVARRLRHPGGRLSQTSAAGQHAAHTGQHAVNAGRHAADEGQRNGLVPWLAVAVKLRRFGGGEILRTLSRM